MMFLVRKGRGHNENHWDSKGHSQETNHLLTDLIWWKKVFRRLASPLAKSWHAQDA